MHKLTFTKFSIITCCRGPKNTSSIVLGFCFKTQHQVIRPEARNNGSETTMCISSRRMNGWPSSTPEFNVLDYSIWSILEAKAWAKAHKTVESFVLQEMVAWHKEQDVCDGKYV
uniref:Uncharacterized protein n=1 Tax=Acrobeloides nanus TaxID=290746 RepID=A0A914C4U8_9BILA